MLIAHSQLTVHHVSSSVTEKPVANVGDRISNSMREKQIKKIQIKLNAFSKVCGDKIIQN